MACPTRRGRQQPGFACEECRRRKARCDRVRPKCGFCTENELQCVFVDKRQQRGPIKGQITSMQSQLGRCLSCLVVSRLVCASVIMRLPCVRSGHRHLQGLPLCSPICRDQCTWFWGLCCAASLPFHMVESSELANMGCLMLSATLRWQLDRYLRHRPPPSITMAGELDEPPANIQTMLDDFDVQVAALNQDATATTTLSTSTALMPAPAISSKDAAPAGAGLSWPDPTWLDRQWQDVSSTSLVPSSDMTVSSATTLTDPLSFDLLNETPPPPPSTTTTTTTSTTRRDSCTKVMLTDLIRAELYTT